MVQFLEKIDKCCEDNLRTKIAQFACHCEPIISLPDFQTFIEEAPAVFGDMWDLFSEIRGVKSNQPAQEDKNVPRRHSVFFQLIGMACVANRQRLKH